MRLLLVEDDRRIAADVAAALEAAAAMSWRRCATARRHGSAATPRTTARSSLTSDCRNGWALRAQAVAREWPSHAGADPDGGGTWSERVDGIDAAPMTTCPSRSGWRNSWRGCAPSSGVRQGTPPHRQRGRYHARRATDEGQRAWRAGYPCPRSNIGLSLPC